MSPEVDSLRIVGGRYELEVCIGRGGMGEVWRARHVALNSYVAIKLLHGALASEDRTRQRFLKEAQVTAQLKTRHAVQVFDFGVTEEGLPFLVMELLDGETLDQRLGRLGRLSPEATVRILRPASRALDRAHQLGIIHRDFKPENLFIVVDEEGMETVKVVDFGIAKLVGELEPDASSPGSLREGRHPLSTFTRTATLVGTPYYMGPEQIAVKPLTPAVDIWAIGIVAFECLTGHRPFDADDLASLFTRIEVRDHARVSELVPEIPSAFEAWFDKACALDPRNRFATAHEAVIELTRALGIETGMDGARTTQDSHLWETSAMQGGAGNSVAPFSHLNSGVFTPVSPMVSRGPPRVFTPESLMTPVSPVLARGPSVGVMSVSTQDASRVGRALSAFRSLPLLVRVFAGTVGSVVVLALAIGLIRRATERSSNRGAQPAIRLLGESEVPPARTGQLVASATPLGETVAAPSALASSHVSVAASELGPDARKPVEEAKRSEVLRADESSKEDTSKRSDRVRAPKGSTTSPPAPSHEDSNRSKRGTRNPKSVPPSGTVPPPPAPAPAPAPADPASPFKLPPLGL